MAENTHNTKIVISGDDSGATGALNRVNGLLNGGVVKALGSVRSAINGVMRAFGLFGLAMQGIQIVIEGYKKLSEWMHRAETAAKALREELAKASHEIAVERAEDAYKRLNKRIEESIRLEKERSKILADRKTTSRDLEDADAERRKQLEISRLDPNAENYADQKKAIERRYAIAASDTKAARAREDNNAAAKELYDQAKGKDSEADRFRKLYAMNRQNAKVAEWNAQKFRIESDEKGDAADEKAKKWAEEFKKASKAAEEFKEKMVAARKEAASLRRLAGEKAGGNLSANIRNDAEKLAIENNAKAEAAEKKKQADKELKQKKDQEDKEQKQEADKNAKEQKTAQQSLEDKKLARQKEEDLAALDPTDKDYEKRKREIEYTYAVKAAENKIRRADNETDRQAAEEEKKALSIKYNAESRNADLTGMVEREEAWREKLAAQQTGVSQNRLTAMGLGSGGIDRTAQDQAKDVKTLVSLAREQIAVIRENKPISRATYAP